MRVLWVEDNRLEVLSLKRSFEELNAVEELRLVASIERARKAATETTYDLVILDSSFPRDNGHQSHSGPIFFRDLRGGKFGDYGRTVKVWFYTNWAEHVERAVQDVMPGPDRIFAKKPASAAEQMLDDFLAIINS